EFPPLTFANAVGVKLWNVPPTKFATGVVPPIVVVWPRMRLPVRTVLFPKEDWKRLEEKIEFGSEHVFPLAAIGIVAPLLTIDGLPLTMASETQQPVDTFVGMVMTI